VVLLKVLSGKAAGREVTARRFPFLVGRAPDAGLVLSDDGVWEQHCRLQLDPGRGVVLATVPPAVSLVNLEPVQEAQLRSGDLIQVGAARLQFWLAPPQQAGLRLREALTWTAIFGLAALQVAAAWWLTR
jgi:pSer/pThr/pTyr-binding forkhead associated (FHA) protein